MIAARCIATHGEVAVSATAASANAALAERMPLAQSQEPLPETVAFLTS
jgi:hypothetical protein